MSLHKIFAYKSPAKKSAIQGLPLPLLCNYHLVSYDPEISVDIYGNLNDWSSSQMTDQRVTWGVPWGTIWLFNIAMENHHAINR